MKDSDINSAYAAMEAWQMQDLENKYQAIKDEAIFENARASKEQINLLTEQVSSIQEQNSLLKKMYEEAKTDAEENKKQAKHNKIFGWVSFAVGTAIGITGVLVGILL